MSNTDNKLHFLTYMLTRESNFTTSTEKDGTTINNVGRKEF